MSAAADCNIPPTEQSRSASVVIAVVALALCAALHVASAQAADNSRRETQVASDVDAQRFAGDAEAGARGITDIHGLVRTGTVGGEFADLPPQTAPFGPAFGFSVAMHGDWLVVGAPGTVWTHDGSTDEHGAVFVFRRSGGGWQLQERLLLAFSGVGEAGMRCGHAVALRLPHLAIGCPELELGGQPAGVVAMLKLDASGESFARDFTMYGSVPGRCGAAVALTRDFMAYGCPLAGANESGEVRVRRRDPVTDRFSETDGTRVPPEDSPGQAFGSALAMYQPALVGVGPPDLRLAIGAPDTVYAGSIWPRGSVYLFHRNRDTGAWNHETTLRPGSAGADGDELASFGTALDMGWNQLVVGAPNNRAVSGDALPGPGTVHRFEYTPIVGSIYQWQAREEASAVNLPDGRHGGMRFGDAVAIGHDNLIAVAAPATEGTYGNGDPAEAVGLVEFRRTASGDWSVLNYAGETRPAPLSAITRPAGRFGHSLDADVAQRRMAIGYPHSGSTLMIPGQPSRPRGAVWIYETDAIFGDGFQCGAASPGCD